MLAVIGMFGVGDLVEGLQEGGMVVHLVFHVERSGVYDWRVGNRMSSSRGHEQGEEKVLHLCIKRNVRDISCGLCEVRKVATR